MADITELQIPVVTYDYTQKSEKFWEYKISDIADEDKPQQAWDLLVAWSQDPQSGTVPKLFRDLWAIYEKPSGYPMPNYQPSYVYIRKLFIRDTEQREYDVMFLRYPIEQRGYWLYSLCGDNRMFWGFKWYYSDYRKQWEFRMQSLENVSLLDNVQYYFIGCVSLYMGQQGYSMPVLYPINGVIMSILDQKGNVILEFTDPAPTSLTIGQYNDKLVLMYVEMYNQQYANFSAKVQMLEYHRQQMLASLEAMYSGQDGAAQAAKAEQIRALMTSKGEQVRNIEILRDSELDRIRSQCDFAVKLVEDKKKTALLDYEALCKEAYVQKMKSDKHVGQRLSAQGRNGGHSESARTGIVITYQQRLLELKQAYNAELDAINNEVAETRQEYAEKLTEKAAEYSNIIVDLGAQYNKMQLEVTMRCDQQIFDVSLQREAAIASCKMDFDQMIQAETLYQRYFEKEIQAYFEDMKIIELDV